MDCTFRCLLIFMLKIIFIIALLGPISCSRTVRREGNNGTVEKRAKHNSSVENLKESIEDLTDDSNNNAKAILSEASGRSNSSVDAQDPLQPDSGSKETQSDNNNKSNKTLRRYGSHKVKVAYLLGPKPETTQKHKKKSRSPKDDHEVKTLKGLGGQKTKGVMSTLQGRIEQGQAEYLKQQVDMVTFDNNTVVAKIKEEGDNHQENQSSSNEANKDDHYDSENNKDNDDSEDNDDSKNNKDNVVNEHYKDNDESENNKDNDDSENNEDNDDSENNEDNGDSENNEDNDYSENNDDSENNENNDYSENNDDSKNNIDHDDSEDNTQSSAEDLNQNGPDTTDNGQNEQGAEADFNDDIDPIILDEEQEKERSKEEIKQGDKDFSYGHIYQPNVYSEFGRRRLLPFNNEDENLIKLVKEDVRPTNLEPKWATPDLVLAVAKESRALQREKPINPSEHLIDKNILRSGNYWNGLWKEEVNPLILRSKPKEPLAVISTNINPGSNIYELVTKLRKISPRLLYVINKNAN